MEPSTQPAKRCRCGNDYVSEFGDGQVCPSCRPTLLAKGWREAVAAIPERYRVATYDELQGVDKQIARGRTWARFEDHSEAWLTIQGSSGNGKTHLAACIVREAAERYVKDVGWINAAVFGSEILDMSFRGGVGAYIKQFTQPYLLVIDDLGVEGASESVRTAMYRLINTRWERRLRTIVTTNLTLADISTKLGQQIADRLLRTGRFIKFEGESYAWKQIFERQHGGRSPDPTPGGQAKASGNICPGGAPSTID
jgi:hypothetical protein